MDIFLPQSTIPIFTSLWLCLRTGRNGRCTCFHLSPCSAKSFKTMCHLGGRDISISPWCPSQPWFTPTSTVCGLLSNHSIPLRSAITAELHLRWKVVPSARMKAHMQHYQAAKGVSRLATAPTAPRRPSTNRMYDDRELICVCCQSCSLKSHFSVSPF